MFRAFADRSPPSRCVLVAALASSARASIEHPDPRAEALYESAMKRLERPTIEGRREAIVELEQATLYDKPQPELRAGAARLYAQWRLPSRTRAGATSGRAPRRPPTGRAPRARTDVRGATGSSTSNRPRSTAPCCICRRAGRLDPHLEDAWIQLTPLLIELGEVAGAEAAAERAIEADPNLPERHSWRSRIRRTAWAACNVPTALFHRVVPRCSRIVRDQFEDHRARSRPSADTMMLAPPSRSPRQPDVRARGSGSDNDPDLASPENEAQLEYWSRVAHAYFLYFNAKRREWDERGEVYVRYGPPELTPRTTRWATLRVTHGVTLDYPANAAASGSYPELGMRVWLRGPLADRVLPAADRDRRTAWIRPVPRFAGAGRREALAIRWRPRRVPQAAARRRAAALISGAVARFETDDGPRLLGAGRAPGEPGDSLRGRVGRARLDAARGRRAASQALSPSACDATAPAASPTSPTDAAARALPHRPVSVRDGDQAPRRVPRRGRHCRAREPGPQPERRRRRLRAAERVRAPGCANRAQPAARVTGADRRSPRTSRSTIWLPAATVTRGFEYQYTVKSVEKDPRIWIKRSCSVRGRASPRSQASREEENPRQRAPPVRERPGRVAAGAGSIGSGDHACAIWSPATSATRSAGSSRWRSH